MLMNNKDEQHKKWLASVNFCPSVTANSELGKKPHMSCPTQITTANTEEQKGKHIKNHNESQKGGKYILD